MNWKKIKKKKTKVIQSSQSLERKLQRIKAELDDTNTDEDEDQDDENK